jgi:hypothetical protein
VWSLESPIPDIGTGVAYEGGEKEYIGRKEEEKIREKGREREETKQGKGQ